MNLPESDFFSTLTIKELSWFLNQPGAFSSELYSKSDFIKTEERCYICSEIKQEEWILNNGKYLCLKCLNLVKCIKYPEAGHEKEFKYLKNCEHICNENIKANTLYEKEFLNFKNSESQKRKELEEKFSKLPEFNQKNSDVFMIIFSLLPLFLIKETPLVVIASLIMLGLWINSKTESPNINTKVNEELNRWRKNATPTKKQKLELPSRPIIKGFFDEENLNLNEFDKKILHIFEHWPDYPPFWKALREKALVRDSHTCQVAGCPSRLPIHCHHIISLSKGGSHTLSNLVSICEFHHAMEPSTGHQIIKGKIQNEIFSSVVEHTRTNPVNKGTHKVSRSMRRHKLISIEDIKEVVNQYGLKCPSCYKKLYFELRCKSNNIIIICNECLKKMIVPQQLYEEIGPILVKVLYRNNKSQRNYQLNNSVFYNQVSVDMLKWERIKESESTTRNDFHVEKTINSNKETLPRLQKKEKVIFSKKENNLKKKINKPSSSYIKKRKNKFTKLEMLNYAISNNSIIEFKYIDNNNKTSHRRIKCLSGNIEKTGVKYIKGLISGFCYLRNAKRSFSANKMTHCKLVDEILNEEELQNDCNQTSHYRDNKDYNLNSKKVSVEKQVPKSTFKITCSHCLYVFRLSSVNKIISVRCIRCKSICNKDDIVDSTFN